MATIVVTGAAGFIGSHTVDRLLRFGYEVIGIDNFRTGKRENLAAALAQTGFRLEEADCTDQAQMVEVMERARPKAVIHQAALVSVPQSLEDPELNFRQNVEATHNIGFAASKCGVERIVFASSAAVYGHQKYLPISERASVHAISPYGAAKLASENLLHGYGRSYGMMVICQRYFNVYGPRQDRSSPYSGVISIFEKRFREGEPVTIYGNGHQTRDFVSVHDVARASVVAATGRVVSSGTHNICTGRRTSVRDLIVEFGRLYPDHPAPKVAEKRPGDIEHSCGDPSRASKHLLFKTEIDVATGLRELIRGIPIEERSLDPRADLTL